MATDVKIEPLLSEDDYLQVYNRLGHFSLKLTNSNVAGGGVRLDSESSQDSMYLSVNTQIKQGQEVATDYLFSAKEGKALKHLDWANADVTGLDPSKNADLKKIEAIKEAREHYAPVKAYYADAEKHFAEFTPDSLSPRLPQVLLPREESYLSVTPLACAGFCAIVSEAVWASYSFIKRADFPVGGSNPQNIGRHAYHMQKPLVMSAPKEDPATRELFALYYKGPRLLPNNQVLKEYLDWKSALLCKGQSTDLNLRNRDKEMVYVKRMLTPVRSHFIAAREALADGQKRGILPSGELLGSPGLPLSKRVLLNPVQFSKGEQVDAVAALLKSVSKKLIAGEGVGWNEAEIYAMAKECVEYFV